jgi:D-3-phosphoglycerate dehydrogenase / 2-oxoglutarate reductase
VQRPDDPPISVNRDPFQSADLPRLLAGYEVCLDDHSYMPTEAIAQCRGLKHIVFLGTGASSYMDVPALNRLGIDVHTIKGSRRRTPWPRQTGGDTRQYRAGGASG